MKKKSMKNNFTTLWYIQAILKYDTLRLLHFFKDYMQWLIDGMIKWSNITCICMSHHVSIWVPGPKKYSSTGKVFSGENNSLKYSYNQKGDHILKLALFFFLDKF